MVTASLAEKARPKSALEGLTSQSGPSIQATLAASTRLDRLNAAMESASLAVMGGTNPFKKLKFFKRAEASHMWKGPMAFGDSSFASMEGVQAM